MSKASASTTLTLVPDMGTFNAYLVCNKGDLWQHYEGSVSAPTAVVPNFATTTPVLSLVVTSSRTTGLEVPDSVRFYLGTVKVGEIEKTGNTYSKSANTDAAYSGMFELLSPAENNGSYGLKIKKNLVAVTNGESGQFRAEFTVSEGSSTATLQATCPFNISEVVTNSSVVVIEAGDNYNFQITEKNQSVKLAAKYYKGLTEVTSGITYKWYKQVYGANAGGGAMANWELISGATGAVLTVAEGDVDSSQLYMVHVLGSTDSTVLGQDTQMVFDSQDVFEIGISRSPEDGQVHKAGDTVAVSCEVYRRGNPVPQVLPAGAVWKFVGVTPAGTNIMQQSSASPTCNVSYDDIAAAGGQLELTVTVEF